jgi:hypothetical protein
MTDMCQMGYTHIFFTIAIYIYTYNVCVLLLLLLLVFHGYVQLQECNQQFGFNHQ